MKDYRTTPVRFTLKTEMLIGEGVARDLAAQLERRQWRRVALVVDEGLYRANEYARETVGALRAGRDGVEMLLAAMPEPSYRYLDEVRAQFAGGRFDCFVGIGGGSTLDLTKAMAVLSVNPGKALEYRGFDKATVTPPPVVALPTTAGTGSEVTPYASFVDTDARWKFGINGEYNYPRLALYDPLFLDSCPRTIFASAGMDAMTHAIESFVAQDATDLSRLFSRQAVGLLFPNLKKVVAGDLSMATKLGLLMGSSCAGVAFMNAGLGPGHALSYPLGVYFDVPHGLAGSVFLPVVMRYNADHGYHGYAPLYDDLFPGAKGRSEAARSMALAEEVTALAAELGIPTDLKGFGVKTDKDLRLIVDNSQQLKHAFAQNPLPFGMPEIEQVVYALR